jgi:ferredoxin
MSQNVKVRVDLDLCVGNAMCRADAPDLFVATTDGQSQATDAAAGESLERLVQIAHDCPVSAIIVEDADTGERLD